MWGYSFMLTILLCVTTRPKFCKSDTTDSSYRLPKNIRPTRYNLTIAPVLKPDINSSIFIGSVKIEVIVLENTKNIAVHARQLNISESSIKIKHLNGIKIDFINTTIDEQRQLYTINLNRELLKDERYIISIEEFSGNLNFDKFGFYLAKYKTAFTKDRVLALTDFQPAGARRAFPCFDEPALKATFIINLIRDEAYITASNEELDSTRYLGNGLYLDKYKETVEMSTYLVVFTFSDYGHTLRNKRHRIIANVEAINVGKTDYVLSISNELLTTLEDFTGVNYTLSKLDLFGVSREYFEPGGMENWGLITISEEFIFYSNYASTTYDLQKCTTFIAHEFSHQWFGNLVTPSWWNYLWLSEGFATYLEYYIPSILKPFWRLMEQFQVEIQQKVFDYDGNIIRKSLNFDLLRDGQLPSGSISYYKGASIIKMVEHFLTPNIFRKAIRNYLESNKFSVVEPSDLYNAFQQAIDEANAHQLLGNQTVSEILHTWDSNFGYPLVNVSRDYANGSILLSQQPFFPSYIFQIKPIWRIPINYVLHSESEYNFSRTSADFWLTEETVTVNNFAVTNWLLVNIQQAGYYRVNYDLTNWRHLIIFLNNEEFSIIHPLNRAQLIDDAFNLAKWNYIPYSIPLNLSKYLTKETDYIPMVSFLNIISHLNVMLAATENYHIFCNYITNLLVPTMNYLGYEEKINDTHLDKLNRVNIITWLCNLGHQHCKSIALRKFRLNQITNETLFSADLEYPFFCGAMQTATIDDWTFLRKRYEYLGDSIQKTRVFQSLGCSRNETILINYLDTIFNATNTISIRERIAAFENLVQFNPIGLNVSLVYFIEHNLDFYEIFSKVKVAELLGMRITTKKQLEQLSKLQIRGVGSRLILSCLIHARKNMDWLSKGFVEDISEWLKDCNSTNVMLHT